MHLEAIRLETLEDNQTVPGQFENCNKKEFQALQDALKMFHFVITHNMSYTTDFADLVQLCVDLGATNLSYLYKGENAKCTSQRTVQEFVECMADVVEEDVLKKFRASVSAGLMLDESTDISVRKELATCVKIQCDGITETKCLNIAEIPDGTADTIVATTTQYFTDAAVSFD